MRRRGIAKALIKSACRYAEQSGYGYVEGYPAHGTFPIRDCGGSEAMYVKQGFDVITAGDGFIARKNIWQRRSNKKYGSN